MNTRACATASPSSTSALASALCVPSPPPPTILKPTDLHIRTQIDTFFQNLSTPPATHVIIEPHPDVLTHMRASGWDAATRPGVHVLAGRWQDFVGDGPRAHELQELVPAGFDVVYTDTFSEEYKGA